MTIRIKYRSGDDEVSERIITDVTVDSPNRIYALCRLRGEGRTFMLSRKEEAVDLNTGQIIPDIWVYFGLPSLKPPPLRMPVFTDLPQHLSTEEAQRQRKADKAALFRRFKYEVIVEVYRAKLFSLFDNRCFRCGAMQRLELDHHFPQYLGGRLVPGNITILCANCNSIKRNKRPSEFYTVDEIERIQPLLKAELELFNFSFNIARWSRCPKEYLVSLGVTEQIAVE